MLRFRTTFFLVSSLLLLLAGCVSTSKVQPDAYGSIQDLPVWTEAVRSDEQMNRYQVSFKVKNNTITGICLLKKSEDGWKGTLMNEMGAKAFDFIIAEKKCRLMNVMPMMDKWYIRNTIADDLYFLFETDNPKAGFQNKTVRFIEHGSLVVRNGKKKKLIRTPDAKISMENLKRNISYSLDRIE